MTTMRRSRSAPLLLIPFGVILAGMLALAGRHFLKPSCEIAAGDWYGTALELVKDYREPCAAFYWLPDASDEFHHLVRLNNFGLVGSDYILEKSPDVFRILLVGDSFPQGLQVEREQGFPWLLQAQLSRETGRNIEVINLSMDAWGTDRQLLLYSLLGWRFQADLVLLSLYTGNDIQDNHIDLEQRRYGYRLNRPFFTTGEGGLELHNSPVFDPAYYPDSRAYQWLTAVQSAQPAPPPENPPLRPRILENEPYRLEYPVELGLYLPEDEQWRFAWAVTEALVLKFRSLAAMQGSAFAAFIIPDRRAVEPEDWSQTLDLYGSIRPELYQADPTQPATRLEDFLKSNDIPQLNLTWTLIARRRGAEAERLYYAGDGHFNPHGHLVVAQRLAGWLQAAGLAE